MGYEPLEVMPGSSKKGSLRSRAIRLTHEKPELRPHLLPFLKEAIGDDGFHTDREEDPLDPEPPRLIDV